MIKLLIIGANGTFDITKMVPSITWSGDYQQCVRTLSFDLVSSYTDQNVPVVPADLGNAVKFYQDGRILFSGFVFSREKSTGDSVVTLKCYDRGFYLKRNKASYNFSGQTAEAIAMRICSDFEIPTGSIVKTGVGITRIFEGASLYDIIQTAYTLASEKTEKKYYQRFDGEKFCVLEKSVTDETLVIEGKSNLMQAVTSESVENMVNRVVITDKNGNQVSIQENADAIKLYGVMQDIIQQSESENSLEKAKSLLRENGEDQKISLDCLGNIANITGGSVVVREAYTGLYGLFYIDSDTHTWKNGQYYNKLVINFENIMDEKEVGKLPNKTGTQTESKTEGKLTEETIWERLQ